MAALGTYLEAELEALTGLGSLPHLPAYDPLPPCDWASSCPMGDLRQGLDPPDKATEVGELSQEARSKDRALLHSQVFHGPTLAP